jgi:dTDP-4-dehydrorhamnose reductase
VTGAAGMLGQDVMRAAGADARGLSRAELDISHLGQVHDAVAAARPDVVVNCAAWTDVDGAEAAEDDALLVNGYGAEHVAAAAGQVGAAIVHVSTDYVFPGDKGTPYVESDATGPLGAYGRTKLAGEEAVLAANPRAHVVRASWLFGASGPNFVATMLRLAGERNALTVVDDQTGCPTYTGHLAAALLEIAASEAYGVWHAAGAGACTWHELAAATFARAGRNVTLTKGTTAALDRPAPRPAWSVLSSERADAVTLPAWEDGLDAYLAETGSLPT